MSKNQGLSSETGENMKIEDAQRKQDKVKFNPTKTCLHPAEESVLRLLLRSSWFFTEKEWAYFCHQSKCSHFRSTKEAVDVILGPILLCVRLADLKFSDACEGLVWALLWGKENSSLIWSGVVTICTELEDGLLRICFPLGIRAGTGLASVQPKY